MRTVYFAALLALTLGLGGVARAEDLPPTPASEAVSPRKLELANKVVEISGTESQITKMLRAIAEKFASDLDAKSEAPNRNKINLQIIMQAETDAMLAKWPEMKRLAANAYAETYSEEELSGLVDFYQSPAGRAFLEKEPKLFVSLQPMLEMARETARQAIEKSTSSP